jgi:hypothetical protein
MRSLRGSAVLAVLAIGVAFAGTALAAKLVPGTYRGQTSDGIAIRLHLNKDHKSGSLTYCSYTAPLVMSGRSFTATKTDAGTGTVLIAAKGRFSKTRPRATGTVEENGCDSVRQTFVVTHK